MFIKLKKRIEISLFELLLFLYLATYFAHNTNGAEELINKFFFVIFGIYSLIRIKLVNNNKGIGYLIWFLTFLTYAFSSCLWAQNSRSVFSTITVYAQIVILIIGETEYVTNIDKVEKLMKLFVLAVTYSLIVLFIKEPNMLNWFPEGDLNPNGWHKNAYSYILYISSLIMIYFKYKYKYNKYIFISLLFAICLLFCNSRKAILMLIMALAFFIVLNSKKPIIFFRNTIIALAILVGMFFLLLNNRYLYSLIGFRFQETLNYFTGRGYIDFSTRERVYLMEYAIELFFEHPIAGIGLDNFAYLLGGVYSKSVYSHNTYLELLSCLGLIGFSLYYYFLFRLLVICVKSLIREKDIISSWCVTMITVSLIFDYLQITYNTVYVHFLYLIIYWFMHFKQFEPIKNKYRLDANAFEEMKTQNVCL